MKYCLDYYGQHLELFHQVDEINIDLSHIKDLKELEFFCEKYKQQRINLCINDYEDAVNNNSLYFAFDFQQKFQTSYYIVIRLPQITTVCKDIKEKYPNAKLFFKVHIVDWDTLLYYLDFGVTDVYIAEAMGFELDKISTIVHDKGTLIRVFPNVAQSACSETAGILKFWIRPEDTEVYEQYIDTYEFFGDEEKQKIYYEIYKNDKQWWGNLKEIIIGLNTDINNMTILPRFAQKRIRCNRQCMKDNKCHMCYNILNLSKTLEEHNLKFIINNEGEKHG